MRKFIKKSLCLMAALLLGVGGEAWAETTTLLEYGTADVAWTTEGLATWTAGGTPTLDSADNPNYVGITGGNGSYATSKTISPTEGTIINLTAVWRGRSNTGRAFSAGNGSYFRFGNIVVAQNDQDQKHGYGFTGLSNIKTVTTFSAGSYRTDIANCTWLKIEAEINTATNTLVSFTIKSEDGNTTYVTQSNIALASPDYTTVAFGYHKTGSVSYANAEQLKSIKITETTQTVQYADYTVHFVDQNGDKVKEDAIRNGEVGTTVNANTDDIATYYNGGFKYVYGNDGGGVEVANDGTSEFTITYTKYGQFTYTVNAVDEDNNPLAILAEATVYEGETKTLKWSRFIKVDEQWYIATETTYTLTATEEGSKDIVFNKSNIAYFFEMENLTRAGGAFLTEESGSYSNNARLRMSRGSTHYTPALVGGVYLLNIGCVNSNASSSDVYVYTRSSEGTISDTLYTHTATSGNTTLSYMITVPDGYSIAFNGDEGGSANNNARMDYMTLKRINNMSIVGDFSENGWEPTGGIAMTQDSENANIWTAVVTDYVVTSDKYDFQYKAIANQNWSDYVIGNPNASNSDKNQEYNFDYDGARAGVYTLTFTLNTTDNTVELAIEKQKQTFTVAYVDNDGWGDIHAYTFNSETLGGWPGTAMDEYKTIDGKKVYTISFAATDAPANIIFNGNSRQTGNLDFVNNSLYGIAWPTANVTSAGYATFCSPYALDFSDVSGVTAYIASESDKDVSFVEVTSVPAETGVLLKANEGSYSIKPVVNSTTDVTANALVGVLENTEVAAGSFVLMNGTPGVGFYKTKNAFTVGANTAYLPGDVAARTFIGLDDETTGISAALMNGERVNGEVYNLNGQRVAQPAKGLYIVNEKKVIINK